MTEARTGKVSFAQTTLLIHRMIRGTITASDAAGRLGVPRDRLAIYRDFVRRHCRTILEKNFQVFHQLVNPKRWEQLVDSYYEQYPFDDLELNGNAAQFSHFLSELGPGNGSGISEFLGELAELEWKEFVAYSAEVNVPRPGTIAEPVVNPSLIALQLVYPVARFLHDWRVSTQDSRPPLPEVEEGTVLVFRHPQTEMVRSLQASDPLLLIIKMLHDGIPRRAVLEQSGLTSDQLDAHMEDAVELGVICR